VTAAALLLAVALFLAPASPRHRLIPPRRSRMVWRRGPVGAVSVAAVALSAMVIPMTVVAAAAIVVATIAVRRRRSSSAARRARESDALQGALAVLIGELRVGAHPVVAFDVAAREVDGPVADGLRAVAARARLGADVPAGLLAAARVSSLGAHWQRLSVCWRLAQSHGLAIATLMRTAHRDIVERERFSSRVSAGMAGARTTAAVLAGLPVLGIGLGQAIGAEPLRFLMSGGLGGWLLVSGVPLACCGLLWSDRIIHRVMT
jgi:tight adherence protein B